MQTLTSRLLGGIGLDTFTTEYWGRRPLHVRLGRERFESLIGGPFGDEDFVSAVQYSESVPKAGERIDAVPGTTSPKGARMFIASAAQVRALHGAGMTIIGQIRHPKLTALAHRIKQELGHPGPVSTAGSWSPGVEGVGLHFDALDTFVFQAQGAKVWWLARQPAVATPRRGAQIRHDGSYDFNGLALEWENGACDPGELDRIVLEAGDILYLPAGVIHRTEASGGSLSFMVSMTPETPIPALMRALEDSLATRPEWRHIPCATDTPEGRLPHPGHHKALLRELSATLRRLDPAGPEMQTVWNRFLQDAGAQLTGEPR